MSWDFHITIDDREMMGLFRRLIDRAQDLRPALDSIAGMLKTSTDQRFEKAQDPDGKPWTPLARSTVKAKAKAGHELMLQWSGRLRSSIATAVSADSVTIGTNIVYAGIHQFGGTIEHHAQSRQIYRRFAETKGKGGTIHRELLPGFVPKGKSNFASWHERGDHSITIPARPYLGINAADRSAAVEILRAHIGQLA